MNLKLARVKSVLSIRYWGVCWYFSNSVNQPCSFNGGNAPVTTFHSVIESPEPVNRVIPPSITWINNITTPVTIQALTHRLAFSFSTFEIMVAKVQAKKYQPRN